MKRREFITLLGSAAVAWPLAARAQQAGKVPTIGFLGQSTRSAGSEWVAAFVQRLRELGWSEGRTIAIEYRWGEGPRGTLRRGRGRVRPSQGRRHCYLTEAVPPKLYGGTERVISWLSEELVALGHDVTLFASGDSCTSARLEAIWPRALRLDSSIRDPYGLHMTMLEQVRRQAEDFDFLHFHLDYFPFSLFSRQPTPFITTLHGRLDLPELQPVFTTFSSVPVISISNSQRRPVPPAGWHTPIYHGLPAHLLTPQPVKPNYLAFLRRISPEKCIDRAILLAERA